MKKLLAQALVIWKTNFEHFERIKTLGDAKKQFFICPVLARFEFHKCDVTLLVQARALQAALKSPNVQSPFALTYYSP